MEQSEKICSRCKKIRSIDKFYRLPKGEVGLSGDCYRHVCRVCMSKWGQRRHFIKKREMINRTLEWKKKNKEKNKENSFKRYHSPVGKITRRLESAFRFFLGPFHESIFFLTGLTPSLLVKYIEHTKPPLQEFVWENYGKTWRLCLLEDVSSFDLRDKGQQKLCFYWKNIRVESNTEEKCKKDLV